MIEVEGLTKRYGETVAVDGLSFTVEPGRVTGFIGPNGAGKSTTMRLILGLDAPDAGPRPGRRPAVRDARAPAARSGRAARRRATSTAACVPGDHLLWQARSNAMPDSRVPEVLEPRRARERRAPARRRLLASACASGSASPAALLGDPPLLLFDEPVNGLDPEGIRWIRGFLRALAAEGRTVLVSSHLMSELEDTADHLVVIGRGRLIADTSMRELLARAGGDRVTVRAPQPARGDVASWPTRARRSAPTARR